MLHAGGGHFPAWKNDHLQSLLAFIIKTCELYPTRVLRIPIIQLCRWLCRYDAINELTRSRPGIDEHDEENAHKHPKAYV